MDRNIRLLQDFKQSQVATVEKSSKLQWDAMEFSFSEMEKNMGDLFSIFNESLDKINTEIDRFEIRRNQFEQKYGLDKEEE